VEKSDLGYLNAYQRKKKSGYLRERENFANLPCTHVEASQSLSCIRKRRGEEISEVKTWTEIRLKSSD
jgi:hypothetical protein